MTGLGTRAAGRGPLSPLIFLNPWRSTQYTKYCFTEKLREIRLAGQHCWFFKAIFAAVITFLASNKIGQRCKRGHTMEEWLVCLPYSQKNTGLIPGDTLGSFVMEFPHTVRSMQHQGEMDFSWCKWLLFVSVCCSGVDSRMFFTKAK